MLFFGFVRKKDFVFLTQQNDLLRSYNETLKGVSNTLRETLEQRIRECEKLQYIIFLNNHVKTEETQNIPQQEENNLRPIGLTKKPWNQIKKEMEHDDFLRAQEERSKKNA